MIGCELKEKTQEPMRKFQTLSTYICLPSQVTSTVSHLTVDSSSSDLLNLSEDLSCVLAIDANTLVLRPPPLNPSKITWNYSIIYHSTWQCPVIYFSTTPALSRATVLLHLQISCDGDSDGRYAPDSYDMISQEEHPLTGAPSYYLHPCRTRDLLGVLSGGGEEEGLLSFLSVVLPVVKFPFPAHEYVRLKLAMRDAAIGMI